MKLATLCYVKKDGKTLMLHRIKKKSDMHEGKWNGLGGKLEQGESPEDCVIREIREESGLNIQKPRLKGVLTFPQFGGKGNLEDWYVFVFTADQFTGSLIDSNEGVLSWIDDINIPNLNTWEGDRIFMKWLEQECFFSGKMVYVDGKLAEHSVEFY
ncbi:MAG: 8-oxo-dGTP diphosphatase [Candidatus Marsarchaeota archaeon]|jgi:8-oxo-dGTP diphosphatase|nr:8-oxo-dGTP diphosphatase [Candidatus Marsarchaeota archaeon]